jgi:adenine-specific DNA-methyltransferase
MDKYLGNKRSLLDSIFEFVQEKCPDASSMCDIFAGTTNVGRYFRRRGFDVLSNDVNRFSFVIGAAYLTLDKYPQFKGLKLPRRKSTAELECLQAHFLKAVTRDDDRLFPKTQATAIWEQMRPLANVLAHLNSSSNDSGHGRIVEKFTTFGENSSFRSVRGTTGKRNYFSLPNAQKLDSILETVRRWRLEGAISEPELYILMTAILEEVVIVANVNGTFHDFNRDRLWPNSLQQFTLRLPLIHSSPTKGRVYCQDALELARILPSHDILYIDPPYNFRQYCAYYHFLNFVAAYPFLEDIESYLANLGHVRGQNMEDDFTSDFCFKDRFLKALNQMIADADCRYVVMSYYGGRNHWNHWSKTTHPKDHGLNLFNEYFSNRDIFQNSQTLPLLQLRKNYQSRIGEKKEMVHEYLFFAEKEKGWARVDNAARPTLLSTNERFRLTNFNSFGGRDPFQQGVGERFRRCEAKVA